MLYNGSMFIRIKDKPNGMKSVQIVESYRRGDKVRQDIVRHVGQAATESEVEVLRKLAQSIIIEMENKRHPVLPLFSPEDIYAKKEKKPADDTVRIKRLREEQRIIDGIGDIFGGLYTDLGFDHLLGDNESSKRWNGILRECVMARLANPVSKRRTAALLEEDYGIKISLEKIYRMMDHVSDKEEDIKKEVCRTTLSLFENRVDILFFDVTTLYFESVIQGGLRDFGFSKDCKFNETQVVLALITTTSGLPITYELFPGNMYEGRTLIKMVKKLKEEYTIENIFLAADKAMFSEENLSMMDEEGISYVVAARLKSLPQDMKEDITKGINYKDYTADGDLYRAKEYEYRDRRLIVSYSSERAKKDAADRQRLVLRMMKRAKDGKIKISDLIPNHGTKKYVDITGGSAVINEEKIKMDARWDGYHGVITNRKNEKVESVLKHYQGLWQIEEAFRLSKHDLMMRPVYHWTDERIKAHISICFLAFTLAKQATYRLACKHMPMSFEQLRNELLHTQTSIVVNLDNNKRYGIPSHITADQKRIYQAFGLKRFEVPYVVE